MAGARGKGKGSLWSMGKMESSGNQWLGWLYNLVPVLNATELYT